MGDEPPDVDRISLTGRFVLMSDGETLPITDFYDDDGDECEPDEAVAVQAGRDDYGWLTITLNDDDGKLHA